MTTKKLTIDTTTLRKLQLTEINILKNVIMVIEKLKLRYFAVGGTALGAEKYNGFIPWDDDIDIAMPREDYESFLKNAQQYLPGHLYVQSIYSDKNYCFGVAKVRDLNTVFVEINTEKLNIVNGVFIDIFPIDGYIKGGTSDKIIYKLRQAKISSYLGKEFNRNIKNVILNFLFIFMRKSPNYYCNKNERLLSKIKYGSTDSVFCRTEIFPIRFFDETDIRSFEGIEIKVSKFNKEYLSLAYGDYEKDIDESKKKPHHYVSKIKL